MQPLEPGEIPTSQQPPQQVIQLAELQPLSQSMSVLLPAAGGDSSLTENGAETAQFQVWVNHRGSLFRGSSRVINISCQAFQVVWLTGGTP